MEILDICARISGDNKIRDRNGLVHKWALLTANVQRKVLHPSVDCKSVVSLKADATVASVSHFIHLIRRSAVKSRPHNEYDADVRLTT